MMLSSKGGSLRVAFSPLDVRFSMFNFHSLWTLDILIG